MRFPVKEKLSPEEMEAGLKTVIKDGIAAQVMVSLTMGVFLVAFALKLGASNTTIGLLAAIPSLAQLTQIPAIYFVERVRNRRAISVYIFTVARLLWFPIGLIPFFFLPPKTALFFLIVAILIRSSLVAVGSASWNSWMRDLVPADRLGSFFSKRLTLMTAIAIPLSLAGGYYIDFWKKIFPSLELQAYSMLFFAGGAVGLLGVYFISRIPEPKMAPVKEKLNLWRMISEPFKDANFKNLIVFLGSWSFAVNLAAPFFTVYMLKRLGLEMSFIIVLAVVSQLMSVAFFRLWGKFSDRFSNKSILRVSGPLFIGCILAWTFTTLPQRHLFTIPLLFVIHILIGISAAGVAIGSGNIGLKLAPKGKGTAFLATISLVNSLAAGIGSILGGRFADFFAERELSWTMRWIGPEREFAFQTLNLQQWDFFFIFAFLIGLYSIHRLAMVEETGEVKEKIVVSELLSELGRMTRSFSTAGGLRHITQYSFSIARSALRRQKKGQPEARRDSKEEKS